MTMLNDVSATTGRAHWTFVLELLTRQPLTTGMGSDGNEQILRTLSYRYFDEQAGEWCEAEAPHVSGQAFKATLREHAFLVMAEALGLKEGSVSRDGLRLVLKGGKNDKGETSVSLDDLRELRALLPILDIFGALDQGQALPASGQFSDVRVWGETLAKAGLLPVHGIRGGKPGAETTILPFLREDGSQLPPIPDHLTRGRVEQFKHDLAQTHIAHVVMTDQDKQKLLEGRAEKKASAKPARAEQRRALNESMPYTLQAIPPGVPLYAEIRLVDASPVSAALLAAAIEHWIVSGGHLGSGKSVGRGGCQVKVSGSFAVDARSGELRAPGEAAGLLKQGVNPYAEQLRAHFLESGEKIRARLAEVIR
jgi:hypothetical protein